MAKIAIMDPYLRKFTGDMERYWLNAGHEVRLDRYWNPENANWADIVWLDTADNNLASATNPSQAIMADDANYQPWDLHDMDLSNKRVICRPIDIEVWQGHQNAAHWDVVDEIIFIAPHIRELANVPELPGLRSGTGVHVIPCGVDLDRYKFAERGHGFDIAVVSEKWISKGTDYILQIALKLKQIDPRYKIHWLGQRSDYQWELAYFDDFVEHHKLNIEFTNILLDDQTVDQFLEGKNYLLHGSHKEGFSYATAEAMAKGIKPVLHRFYGADDLWPGITWDSIDQAIDEIVDGDYNSEAYRQYLIDHRYTLPQMMESIDKVINKGESNG